MPKLVLINPSETDYNISRQGFKVQPLNLAYLAALTPPEWEVVIDDENMAPAQLRRDADLVGITTLTATVNRAYDLATGYRREGVPVVLGGIHASMVPEEAARFADAVVVGEGESVWAAVLSDSQTGGMQPRYNGERLEFRTAVRPRRDLLSDRYTIGSIQTSRGCPFNCEFCSVRAFNGDKFRQREVSDVLDELAEMRQKLVFFADDNLIGYSTTSRERAKQVFRGMIERGLKKTWFCQTSINFADDEEMLRLAAQSGCMLILVGIESIDDGVLGGKMDKKINVRRGSKYYYEFLKTVHRHRIMVLGTMVFGNDEAGPGIFEDTTHFYSRSGLDVPWPGFLTPYPGTPLFERLKNEGRLMFTAYPDDWRRYNSMFVIRPLSGSARDYLERFRRFTARSYSLPQVLARTARALLYSWSPVRCLLVYNLNRSLARRYRLGLAKPHADTRPPEPSTAGI